MFAFTFHNAMQLLDCAGDNDLHTKSVSLKLYQTEETDF